MRSFVIIAALIVAACGLPTREFIPVLDSDVDYSAWTLPALSAALQDPNTPTALIPYLSDALNHMMAEMMAGNNPETVIVVTPANLLDETPLTPVAPIVTPIVPEFIPVLDSDVDYSAWTLPALSAALQDPNTPAALIPYLSDALNHMMAEMWAGNEMETVIVVTPANLLDETPLTPVAPIVTPVVNPVAPVADAVASSPLVQIIVNVNKPNPVPVAPVPVAPVNPIVVNPVPVSPVIVAPSPVVNPVDVIAVNPIAPAPAPVEVNPVDVIAVNPIAPAPVEVNPVDVIAITPPEVNPIDVIAISAPEVNPVDIINPLPIVPVGAVDVVGPML